MGLKDANISFLESHASQASLTETLAAQGRPSPLSFASNPEGGVEWRHGGSMLMHSSRDPAGEAQRLVQSWISSESPDLKGLVVVMGFAGMHHVEALLSVVGKGAGVLVADLSPESFACSLEAVDLRRLERPGVKLRFSVSRSFCKIADEFRGELRTRPDLAVSVLRHPATMRVSKDLYERLMDELHMQARLETANRNTNAKFVQDWVAYTLGSLPRSTELPPVDALKGFFQGRTGIVVGAGPSLRRTLPLLRPLWGRCPVFAAGTALKPMLKAGLRPDFVVAVDSDSKTFPQFEGVDLSGIWLLGCNSLPERIFNFFEGRAFLFSANLSESLNKWLESFGALPEKATVGGTVATTAIDLARLCGCKDIALCGMDLAFADDGSTHAEDSIYHGQKAKDCVEAKGNYKDSVLTTWQFSLYIRMLSNYMYCDTRSGDVRYWNINDAGARLGHAILVNPSNLSTVEAPGEDFDKGSLIASLASSSRRVVERESVLAALRSALAGLSDVFSASSSALAACKIVFESDESVKHSRMLLKELASLDARITAPSSGASLLLDAVLRLMFSDMIAKAESSSEEGLKKAAGLNMSFYASVNSASAWLTGVLKGALANLEGKRL